MEVYEKDTRKHRPLILKLPSILVWKTGKKKAEGGGAKAVPPPIPPCSRQEQSLV